MERKKTENPIPSHRTTIINTSPTHTPTPFLNQNTSSNLSPSHVLFPCTTSSLTSQYV